MCALGIKSALQFPQYLGQSPHCDFASMRVQGLDEPTHVRPFEFVGKIHRHGKPGDRRLALILSIEHNDWILEVADANLVDCDLAVVDLILNIAHRLNLGLSGVNATGGASFTDHYLAKARQRRLKIPPDPTRNIFARWIL